MRLLYLAFFKIEAISSLDWPNMQDFDISCWCCNLGKKLDLLAISINHFFVSGNYGDKITSFLKK